MCNQINTIKIRLELHNLYSSLLCHMLESDSEALEKVEKVSKNILKELQKQQNSRTESTTGRRCSKKEQKVDPFCRVSHLSR